MKKIYWILGIIFIFLLAVIIGNSRLGNRNPTATINKHTFNLYVAKNPKDKKIGLSKYRNIPQNYAMIFLFDKPYFYSFWMKGMRFPVDIIFIKDEQIVTVYKNVTPVKSQDGNLVIYQPISPADKVLEIGAGLSEKYNIKENDTVTLKNI